MIKNKIYRFNLTPQTALRVNQSDRIFFKIPRDKLYPSGLKRLKKLERSNQYAADLKEMAHKMEFTIPTHGMFIRFYFPCPKSWSNKKKTQHHGKPCLGKIDIDNAIKKVFDSLCNQDKYIAHIQASKQWVYAEEGWIEIEILPFEFPPIIMPDKIK